MNTIIYTRVSTQMQTSSNSHSLDNQLERLKKYCELNDLKNIIHLEDAGISGKTIKNRPSFSKMLELVKNGEIDNVVVPSLSRFARNVKDTLQTLELFKKQNIRFHSLNENIDTSTSIGRFLITIISALNQMEVEQTSERISSVLQHRKSNGYASGAVPFGFDKLPDKSLVPNLKELHTIKIAKGLRKQNYTLAEIAKELTKKKRLNKRGVCNWHPYQVYRLTKNLSNQKFAV